MNKKSLAFDAAPTNAPVLAANFTIALEPAATKQRWLNDDSVLAVLRFGEHTAINRGNPREVSIALPALRRRDDPDLIEVWHSVAPIARGSDAGITYASNGAVLFGHLLIEETGEGQLSAATRGAYLDILRLLDRAGYPRLLRMWNYFSAINRDVDGLERYRAFCVGRHEAFGARGFEEHRLAAASAVGSLAPGLLIYFIAARESGLPVENPRQVSAYHYPDCYAPKSPLFSRAILKPWRAGAHLYVSGTASIVGHSTRHFDNTLEQFRETARNLEAIIATANRLRPPALKSSPLKSLAQLSHLKIYLRDANDLPLLDAEVGRVFGSAMPRIYLLAEICRRELLLEIDAFYAEAA
ncbi:MAG: hypothetical protein ACR2FI_11645 [Burkholderiales bacterium]